MRKYEGRNFVTHVRRISGIFRCHVGDKLEAQLMPDHARLAIGALAVRGAHVTVVPIGGENRLHQTTRVLAYPRTDPCVLVHVLQLHL